MTRSDLQTLIRYNDWANARIRACLDGLSAEQLGQTLISSFPSILGTLTHLVSVEWVWLQRWKRQSPTSPPVWVTASSLATLEAAWRDVETDRAEVVAMWTDNDLAGIIDFTYLSGAAGRHRLSEMVLHMVNHSTYHRGQIVTMLRQIGAVPPSTDLIAFYAESNSIPTTTT